MSKQPVHLKSFQTANSLTEVLDQSEYIKNIVEECVDDLTSINTGLQLELRPQEVSPGVENALEKSMAVENKVQDVSDELAVVNQALKEQIDERHVLDAQLATVIKQSDEARHASLHDPLTGLPNRALFNDRLEHGLASANRSGLHFAVMFLDLDNFKMINDSYGHDVGDVVLQTIATRLKDTTREDDTICRHGGDEFLYLLVNTESKSDVMTVVEKIINVVQVPCDIQVRDLNISLSISSSIGISIFPKDGSTADVLLDVADKAMYRAKLNKSGYSFANTDLT